MSRRNAGWQHFFFSIVRSPSSIRTWFPFAVIERRTFLSLLNLVFMSERGINPPRRRPIWPENIHICPGCLNLTVLWRTYNNYHILSSMYGELWLPSPTIHCAEKAVEDWNINGSVGGWGEGWRLFLTFPAAICLFEEYDCCQVFCDRDVDKQEDHKLLISARFLLL